MQIKTHNYTCRKITKMKSVDCNSNSRKKDSYTIYNVGFSYTCIILRLRSICYERCQNKLAHKFWKGPFKMSQTEFCIQNRIKVKADFFYWNENLTTQNKPTI